MNNDGTSQSTTTAHTLLGQDVPTRSASINVAVDPVALVITECITVTSAMRKHARWAHSSVSAILGGGSTKPIPMRVQDQNAKKAAAGLKVADDNDALAERWGIRGKKGKSMQDNPLILAFSKLRIELKGCKDIHTFDTPSLLHPFLQVIRSSSTSAPITSLALIAITKFLAYNIVSRDSPRLAEAMQLLASAITHCRFEASNTAADEIVLLRILKLMEGMMSGPGGDTLGDESVCKMMETGLSMCCQPGLSEFLRRSAEISMVSMCQVIFERLKHLEVEAGPAPEALDEDTKDDMDAVRMDPATGGETIVNGGSLQVPGSQLAQERSSGSIDRAPEGSDDSHSVTVNGSHVDIPRIPEDGAEDKAVSIKPYSLPSIRELFRVLVDLLDPHDMQHTDTMRVMALRIVDVALEVAGPSIANHPSLANLAKDTLCRHLFQLVRSENMAILNESLRVAGTLLATCRGVLKLQQELYISYLVTCLFPKFEIPQEPGIPPSLYEGVPQAPGLAKPAPSAQPGSGRNTPVPVADRRKLGLEGGSRKPDAREAMVENLGALVRIPSFMVELFVNYDCETDRSDLCLDMVGLLSRNAFPDSATWSTTNVPPLCLDALLSYVQFVHDRLDDEPVTDGYPDLEQLRAQRNRKKTIIRGATKFNENAKAGIAFLVSQGVIENADDPRAIARFLRGTSRIDKKGLGDYLSKKSNGEVLNAFLDTFDFTGQRLDQALRQLLITFRLPGESQLIERIVTEFSEKYMATAKPEHIANNDAVFTLTYAIIMLNTDQHNPNLGKSKRMNFEDFVRNLRGVNNNENFDDEFLREIFDSIRTKEIVLPEEHHNKESYDHAWKELLLKVHSASDVVLCDTNVFDGDMFAATWKPIVATLSFVFMSATDDAVFGRIVTGFYQCAAIASRYGLSEALDRIIYCLAHISTLATDQPPSTALNTEVQADKKSVMVSETAVRFGRDDRAQLALVVLFRVINGNEAALREGWTYITRIILNLFVNSLIPPSFSSIPKTIDLPPIPLQTPAQVIDRGLKAAEAGLFSALTSYVSSFANDEPPEPSDQEIEYTLCTVDCVNASALDEVFYNISQMPLDTLQILLGSLLTQIPEGSSPRVIVVKPEVTPTSPRQPNGTRPRVGRQLYDPSSIFVLELATLLALRDERTVEQLGKDVVEALQAVIRDSSNTHPVTVSRATYYLLSLLKASNDFDFLRAPVLLHTFSSFPSELLKQCAIPILRGLSECVDGPAALRVEMANSPDFWSILRSLRTIPEAAPAVFSILENITDPSAPGVTPDNYEAAVSLLNDFATDASIGATDEQRMDQAARRGKPVTPKKTRNSEIVSRGNRAMAVIYRMTSRVPHFIEKSHLETTEAWAAYWSPIFRALTTQCLNPCREIRHQAFSSLQRSLLSSDLASPDHKEWTAIFSEVLFPLINQLLKPEVYQSDPIGMSETRVQAATLLCKIFLHYLVLLTEWDGMLDLWVKILGIMDRLMNSGQGDNLEEAVSENLKNILLVMSNGGYLAPPEEKPEQAELWRETWKRIDKFLPDMMGELFPEEANRPKQPQQQPPAAAAKRDEPESGDIGEQSRSEEVTSKKVPAGPTSPASQVALESQVL